MDEKEKWERYMMASEYPFIRSGMTMREFDKERIYYLKNIEKVKDGSYIPLWKQEKQ